MQHYKAGMRLVVVLIAVVVFIGLVLMMSPTSASPSNPSVPSTVEGPTSAGT